MAPRESPRPNPRERTTHNRDRRRSYAGSPRKSLPHAPSSAATSQALSVDALLKLDRLNQQRASREVTPKKARRKRQREIIDEKLVVERSRRQYKRKKRRIVSGALLEEGHSGRLRGIRGGEKYEGNWDGAWFQKKRLCRFPSIDLVAGTKLCYIGIYVGIGIIVALIIVVVAIVLSQKHHKSSSDSSTGSGTNESGKPSNSNLNGMSESDIPAAAQETYLDPFTWYDTSDFNVTYTNDTVGGLPLMGLNSTWDDSKGANSNTPPISSSWGSYAALPARGVNLGGWLSLEPFITPSLFNYDSQLGIIDEWTLTTYLGNNANSVLEKHYATFVSEQTFIDIAAAGLDHVRIPFSYWAVTTYQGDPYVFRTSWRYLLRGIEWARKYGLRINLDVHGLPGSQNGWNHSGRLGPIGWLNGTDGALNAQRSLDIHDQLSQFFAQERYKNIVTFYGLVNEPKMTALVMSDVLDWTANAYEVVKKNGVNAYVVFGDGFEGLANWQGKLTGYDGLVLDVHQYEIFNAGQIVYNHTNKVNYACSGWTEQTEQSMDTSTGFGPTMVAEWSQADTDCAQNLNNIGWGTRWEGTYASGDASTQVLSPHCPAQDSSCSCTNANADSGTYSDTYKQFLLMFAEAQMTSFEKGWGWFYWTWVTEDATQWSYQLGMASGILPKLAYKRDFNCSTTVPTFSGLPEVY